MVRYRVKFGFAFGKQGKYNEAIRYYTEALRIFPDYAEAHNNLGNVLRSLRRYEEAATHCSAAIKINPDSDSALNNLGRCLAEMGRTSDAIHAYPTRSESVKWAFRQLAER